MIRIFFANPRVENFFESLETDIKSSALRDFTALSDYGHLLRMPLSRSLGRGLFELRIINRGHIRFIYAFHNDSAYMLHGFFKKTEQISKHDLEYAKKQFGLLK